MPEDKTLPRRGPLPEPETIEEAQKQLAREAFPAPDVQLVVMNAEEFTAICPRSGQPDFGTVSIEYVPGAKCLESKALKYYLWAYRNEGAFCESLAARIADDIVSAIAPVWVRVEARQNVRGGISIVALAERGERGERGEPGSR